MIGRLPTLEAAVLAKHTHSIKPSKAVPMGSAPAAAWRLCSQEVADALAACLTRGTVEQGLHEDLLNADLCLIPKPGKQPDRPANLRPLDILGPDAKGLAGATGEALAPCISHSLSHLPQFAYLPGRVLSDALDRESAASKPSRRGHFCFGSESSL